MTWRGFAILAMFYFLLRWVVQRISPWPFPICRVLMKNWPKNFDIDISILIMTKGFCSWKCWYIDINVHIKIDKGSCTYYVIMDGGGLSKWLQYSIGWGLAKWLQYYIGVVRQMITVLHRGGVSNAYGTPWILGCYIRNIISRDLTKKSDFFSVGKKSFLGGMSKLLQLYIGGVRQNDYSIT